jgi:hypothetical protein
MLTTLMCAWLYGNLPGAGISHTRAESLPAARSARHAHLAEPVGLASPRQIAVTASANRCAASSASLSSGTGNRRMQRDLELVDPRPSPSAMSRNGRSSSTITPCSAASAQVAQDADCRRETTSVARASESSRVHQPTESSCVLDDRDVRDRVFGCHGLVTRNARRWFGRRVDGARPDSPSSRSAQVRAAR